MTMMCKVCKMFSPRKKAVYCMGCAKDVAACQHDAERNGWSYLFQEVSTSERVFRSLILDFQVTSPSIGRGRKRDAFDYQRFFNEQPDANTSQMPPAIHRDLTRRSTGAQGFVHDIVNGRRLSSDLAGLGQELNARSDHFNQNIACLSTGPRSRAPRLPRPHLLFAHCSVFVNVDAFRPCKDIMAAMSMLHKDMAQSYKAYAVTGDKLLYFQVLEVCQNLVKLVNKDWASSEAKPSRQSRPRSESLEKQDLTLQSNKFNSEEVAARRQRQEAAQKVGYAAAVAAEKRVSRKKSQEVARKWLLLPQQSRTWKWTRRERLRLRRTRQEGRILKRRLC